MEDYMGMKLDSDSSIEVTPREIQDVVTVKK
jgi:hypothetical protein